MSLWSSGLRRVAVLVGTLAALVAFVALAVPASVELGRARALRRDYRYGDDVARRVVVSSLRQLAFGEAEMGYSTNGVVSDHDLYMLVHAELRRIQADEDLGEAAASGRLPVRYAYLDGHDLDVLCLKRVLADRLPQMPAPSPTDTWPWPLGPVPQGWETAPVLLGLPASPTVRAVAQQVVADDPLLSINTCGQVVSADVQVWGVRYALACVREDPDQRAREAGEVAARAAEVAARADAAAGDDDYAYVRAAFGELAGSCSYVVDASSSVHFNDVYGALVEGSSRCYGLAGALKLVLDARGIPNYLANGSKPSGRHTWNVVYLGGSWHVCDLTLVLDPEERERTVHEGVPTVSYACLTQQRNFYTEHRYVPDQDARLLQLVYEGIVAELG